MTLQSSQLSELHSTLLSAQQRITVLKGEVKAKSAVILDMVSNDPVVQCASGICACLP